MKSLPTSDEIARAILHPARWEGEHFVAESAAERAYAAVREELLADVRNLEVERELAGHGDDRYRAAILDAEMSALRRHLVLLPGGSR